MRFALPLLWSLTCWLAFTHTVAAQSWSLGRARPSLFEIIAVDPTTQPSWPYGTREDLAGDGLSNVAQDEAAADIRSVYADARSQRLWLRAYFTAKTIGSTSTLTFFFIDTDQRAQTGGHAYGTELWPALADALAQDPGGYELAVGVDADGKLIGVFDWNGAQQRWTRQSKPSALVSSERAVARDPLRLLGDDHAYTQVTLDLDEANLDERCLANVFVRSWNDQSGARAFGDVVDSWAVTCRPRLNRFGDPELLRSDQCTSDDTCPGAGRCWEGICVFGYECNSDDACASYQRCQANLCVRIVERACATAADCAGLICEANACVACSDSGARACPTGSTCAPDGRCLSPSGGPYNGDPNQADSGAAVSGERVQGGAFSCSAARATPGCTGTWLALLPLAWCWQRRRAQRRRQRSERGGAADAPPRSESERGGAADAPARFESAQSRGAV